jgi:tetratricopeptide (TPR) repeat protein/TolB-like protein
VSESDDGLPFFSMKFAPGGTLQQVAPALRTEPRQCVALVAKIARAVQYAHSRGILHRDLKPGNILLDARGEPLVSDFGLAKWLDTTSDLTRTLTIFGTPGYIAPEQASAAADELKPTADIYSLGAILFDLLAGRPPFLGTHALSVIRQAAELPAPKLRTLSKLADRDLETICSRCLQRDPSARYRSAHDLAEDLERWLEGRSIIARPVSPPVRIWRWSKRNQKVAGGIAASLALGTMAVFWQIKGSRLASTLRDDRLAARSIIVLPFLDLDTANPDESIARTIAQTLQSNLVESGPARVIPITQHQTEWAGTSDVGDFAEANRQAKARAVLTGSKRVDAGKIRVSVRLMNAATGDILFTRVIQSDSLESVLGTFTTTVAPAIRSIFAENNWSKIGSTARDPGMRNPAAREFIISGRQLLFRGTIEDFEASIRCLQTAIELEPNSALAHAYLSSTLSARVHFVPDPDLLKTAEIEALESLRLDPQSPDGHRALAGLLLQKEDFAAVLEEQLRAIEAGGPEEIVERFTATTLIKLGQPNRALPWLNRARRGTSAPGRVHALIGDCWRLLDDDQKSEAAYRHAMDLRPEDPDGLVGLCYLQLLRNNIEAARRLFEQNQVRSKNYEQIFSDNSAKEMMARIELLARNYPVAERLYAHLVENRSPDRNEYFGAMSYKSALGRVRQLMGDDASGQALLRECLVRELKSARPKNPETLYRIAAVEASLGDRDLAIKYLQDAVAAGWIDFRSPRIDPRFDGLSGDRRFQQILLALTEKVSELRRQTVQPRTRAANGETESP